MKENFYVGSIHFWVLNGKESNLEKWLKEEELDYHRAENFFEIYLNNTNFKECEELCAQINSLTSL